MLKVPVKKLKSGMIVSQSIYGKAGGSYLMKGQELTPSYINRLSNLGIPTVTVTSMDPSVKIPPPEDVVQETTRLTAIENVTAAFKSVEETGRLDVRKMQDVSDKILLDLIDRKENLVQLTDIRLHDAYTFAHSVNVAILSALLGMLMHYTKKDLALLTLGALLHDLGKIKVDTAILNKTSRLDADEFSIMKAHPSDGARRIKEMGSLLPNGAILASIAEGHHERADGNGYPRNLTLENIHPYARIVAIADVYDALTSERPYKKAYTPNLAHNIMVNVDQGHFDPKLLNLFFNNVALYPVGTVLKTIYGFGIVTHCDFGFTEKPSICLFADREGRKLPKVKRIDLRNSKEQKVIEIVISGIELLHFIHELAVDPSVYLTEET